MTYFVASLLVRNKENTTKRKSEVVKSFIIKSDTETLTEDLLKKAETNCQHYLERNREPDLTYRVYITINGRSQDKVQRMLQHQLLDKEMNFENFETKLVSLMNKPDNRITDRILLDLDTKDEIMLNAVKLELKTLGFSKVDKWSEFSDNNYLIKESINGYHIVTSRGFDARDLKDKVEIKRDALLFLDNL